MKFAKSLSRNSVPEWQGYYIGYGPLKKLIKQCKTAQTSSPSDETDYPEFFFELDRNLEMVDKFFNAKYAEYTRWLNHMMAKFARLRLTDLDSDELEDLIGAILEVRAQLRKLQWYAEVNRRGFAKILKKFDKKIGTSLQRGYLQQKVSILLFADEKALADKLAVANTYLSELSAFTVVSEDSDSARSVRAPSTSSQLETLSELKELVVNDDASALDARVNDLKPSQKALLSVLARATALHAEKCVDVLLQKHLTSLDDEFDLNGRNILHRLIISWGRQVEDKRAKEQEAMTKSDGNGVKTAAAALIGSSFSSAAASTDSLIGVNRKFIRPAEHPGRVATPPVGDGQSQVSDDYHSFVFLLSRLQENQRSSLVARDNENRTVLHYACKYGLKNLTEVVLKRMQEWELLKSEDKSYDRWQSVDGETPLSLAVAGNHPKTTLVLLDAIPLSQEAGAPLLDLAARQGFCDIVKLLVTEGGVDVNGVASNNETSLYAAVSLGKLECAKVLLELGANTEVAEATDGWTPLTVASAEGNEAMVKLLVDAGANVDHRDVDGWLAYEHASLRGHFKAAVLTRPDTNLPKSAQELFANQAQGIPPFQAWPNDVLPGTKAPESTIGRENTEEPQSVKTYGHRYLKAGETMLIVTLGTNDTRVTEPAVQLDRVPFSKAHSTQLDTALSIVVSVSSSKDEPAVVELPINESQSTEPLTFYVSNEDDMRLFFDVVPTYSGNNKKALGRAVALLPTITGVVGPNKRSLYETHVLPLLEVDTLEVLGTVRFGFQVVKPFVHPNLDISKFGTYWKSLSSSRVIGHRGSGMNSLAKRSLQLGENTVESFVQAANLGASYVEFDVQLTKDLVPVIYHDFLVGETGVDVPMHGLTLEQFLGLKEAEKGRDVQDADKADTSRPRSKSMSAPKIKHQSSSEYEEMYERMKYTRAYKQRELKGNTRGQAIQSPFTTLEELFKTLPKTIGFNIECKYPTLYESEVEDMENYAVELNTWVDMVMRIVYNHAGERDIVLSSFNPDVCIYLSLKQPSIPVLFLNDGGTYEMCERRASSIQEAVRFCRQWDLFGMVSNAWALVYCPRLVSVVKQSGLVYFSYGAVNNDPAYVKQQLKYGVDAVIVDSVLAVRKGLTS